MKRAVLAISIMAIMVNGIWAQAPDLTVVQADANCTETPGAKSNFTGLECASANIWPGGPCPVEGACSPSCARCIAWRRGRLQLTQPEESLHTIEFSLSYRPKQYSCDSSLWSFGQWQGDVWSSGVNFTSCAAGLLTQQSVYTCLKGRRTFIIGDSMIKALFSRLVSYMRGQARYIEHHFHGGYYMANGTHDVFVEGELLPSLAASTRAKQPSLVAPSTPEDGWDLSATMQLQSFWAPHFAKALAKDGRETPAIWEHVGTSEGADVLIAGAMYQQSTDDFEPYRAALLHYFKLLAQEGKRVRQLFWIATVPKAGEGPELYRERNRKMRDFVTMLKDHAGYGALWAPSQSFFVDLERMYHPRFVRPDGVHFNCNKGPAYPMPVVNDMVGISGSTDCSDLFNLNVIHSILKVACNV